MESECQTDGVIIQAAPVTPPRTIGCPTVARPPRIHDLAAARPTAPADGFPYPAPAPGRIEETTVFAHRVPPWVTIAVLASCGLVVTMQFTLFVPLLPDLALLLGVSGEDASWLLTVTMVVSAVSTPIVARMADMYGKRRMLFVSLAGMILGSLLCALVEAFPALLVGRALQGFASSLIAVGISILRDELPEDKVGSGIALMSATMGIGSGLALPLSGVLYHALGWHSIFWLSAAIGVLLVLAVLLLVEESAVRAPGRFDIVGALLFSIALVCLLLPITKGETWGWRSPPVLALAVMSLLTFAVWVPVQLRRPHPMVDLRIARQRPILVTNIASLFIGFSMFANFILTAQVLQLPATTGVGMGLDASAGGLAMVPMATTMALAAPVTGRLLNVWGGRGVLASGAAIMVLGYVGRYFFGASVLQIVLGSVVVGIGAAAAYAALPALIMSAVPVTETASANGLNTLVRSIGSSLGNAVVAVLLAAHAVQAGGVSLPTATGIDLVIWASAGTALAGLALALLIPRGRAAADGVEETEQAEEMAPSFPAR